MDDIKLITEVFQGSPLHFEFLLKMTQYDLVHKINQNGFVDVKYPQFQNTYSDAQDKLSLFYY